MTGERIKGIIFDMDGTLIEPAIDFVAMRQATGILEGDLLEVIASWGEQSQRAQQALAVIAEFEREAALQMKLMPGARALLEYLDAHRVECAVVTRNNRETLELMISRYELQFSELIDRSFIPPKPEPDALIHILECWSLRPDECIMVGDTHHDMVAAHKAGMACCLIAHAYNEDYRDQADYVVRTLDALIPLLNV